MTESEDKIRIVLDNDLPGWEVINGKDVLKLTRSELGRVLRHAGYPVTEDMDIWARGDQAWTITISSGTCEEEPVSFHFRWSSPDGY